MKALKELSGEIASFSYRRMISTGQFYWPSLKHQLIWYTVVVVAFSLISHLMKGDGPLAIMAVGNISMLLNALFVFAPIALAVRERRSIAALLPVSALEQVVFLVLYFLVLVPGIIYGLDYIIKGYSKLIVEDSTYGIMYDMAEEFSRKNFKGTYFDRFFVASFCLFGVMYFRRNNIVKTVLSMIGITIAYMVGLLTYVVLKLKDISDMSAHIQPEEGMNDELVMWFNKITTTIDISAMVGMVLMVVLLYYTVKKYHV